ncbi:MAG: 2-oxo acid dehydrogenase subunit E2 [Magnetococcales bacterium]|nr:2-oxo acid dehydrogenase subunit E2 [Magnetococcales bacterium]
MTTTTIIVPQINVNDTSVFVVEWLVDAGSKVEVGDPVVAVETSKSVVEVEAETVGYLRCEAEIGEELEIGATLGWIDSQAKGAGQDNAVPTKSSQKIKATAKAQQLADENGIELAAITKRGIITEKDVMRAIEQQTSQVSQTLDNPELNSTDIIIPLNAVQKSAMRVVLRSTQEQAATFMLGEVDVTNTLPKLKEISTKDRSISNYTMADLLLHQAARTLKEFPRFNATLMAGGIVEHSSVDVGVTMEIEEQLYMGVLQNTDQLTIGEIAKKRMAILLNIMRGKGHEAVSQRGTFSVTVLDQPEVHHQVPIIFPDQAGIIGLGGVRREVRVGPDDKPSVRMVAGLSLSYDHRFINGHYAARFLKAISARLVEPQGMNNV